MKNYFFGLVALGVLIFICYHFWTAVTSDNTQGTANIQDIKYVKIAGQNIKVDLALDSVTQAQGLSGRSGLSENSGMLFIFDKSGKYYFWMKGMNFPIDMIWLAPSEGGDTKNAKIIYIKKNATPEAYPETYGPDVNTKYVLEVASGFSDKNNLKEGDSIEFTY
jgi:uncharacterized protein